MNSRITVDLQNAKLLTLLRLESVREGKTIREVVVEAIENHLSHRRENQAILKLADSAFAEWDNPKDSEYDRL